jgi:chromosomal replication initiator protein
MSMAEESRPSSKLNAEQSRRFQQVVERLRAEFGDDLYDAWFSRLALTRASDGEAQLTAPTRFMKTWIDAHFLERLAACFIAEFNEIEFVSIAAPDKALASGAFGDSERLAQSGARVTGE